MAHSHSLDVVFAGTPEFAVHHLDALLASHHRICAVYTQPDRPAGRGKKLSPSPVKQRALQAGLEVRQPLSLKGADAQSELAVLKPDVMVVVAYGLLLPQAVLEIPRLGCINVHASLLPRWRGAAPIQRAIEAGDAETGVTIMQMAIGLDTGDMLHKAHCAITPTDTAASLHDRLAQLGPPALLATLDALARGETSPEPQEDSLSTYAHKIEKQEAEIDWSLGATELTRKVRAFNPFPTAYTFADEERLRIHAVEPGPEPQAGDFAPGTVLRADDDTILVCCGEGTLRLTRLQLAGKRPVSAAEFLNGSGNLLRVGQRLGRQQPHGH